MYKQVLKHVDHSDYESTINPMLKDGWVITNIQADGHSGCWVLLSYGIPCDSGYYTPVFTNWDQNTSHDIDTIQS